MRFDTKDDEYPHRRRPGQLAPSRRTRRYPSISSEKNDTAAESPAESSRPASRQPITTTAQLAAIVRRSIPGKWGQIDPATRVFQALRIAVNHELDRLDTIAPETP